MEYPLFATPKYKVLVVTSAMNVHKSFPLFLRDVDMLSWDLARFGHTLEAIRITVEYVLPSRLRGDNTLGMAEAFWADHKQLVHLVHNSELLGCAANRMEHERWAVEYAVRNGIPLEEIVLVVVDPDGEMDVSLVPRMIQDCLPGYGAVIGSVHYTDEDMEGYKKETDWFKRDGPAQAKLARGTRPWTLPSPGYWVVRLDHVARLHEALGAYRLLYQEMHQHPFGSWGYAGAAHMITAAAAEASGLGDFRTYTVILGSKGRSPNCSLSRQKRRDAQEKSAGEHIATVHEFRRLLELPAIAA
jgi:hypothetical protein